MSSSKLFNSLTLGRTRLHSRLAMEALPSGLTTLEGFVDQKLQSFYRIRAHAGVGLIVIEDTRATLPHIAVPHLGLYADAHIPNMRDCISDIRQESCAALVMIDQPRSFDDDLSLLTNSFAQAAWRAHAAGADGIMLSTIDGGVFSLLNDPTAGSMRVAALLKVIESIRAWLGRRFVIGIRLGVEEGVAGGLALQDARVVARRLTSVGANLIEVTFRVGGDVPLAQFPGWCVPVAAAIKQIVDCPVMVGGQLDEPMAAEQCLAEKAADLIAVGERLKQEPRWIETIKE
jgi:2,4-dienoyl-CoA reductase-like NADH-dependent reductase (Old Yellow Enzyme family)